MTANKYKHLNRLVYFDSILNELHQETHILNRYFTWCLPQAVLGQLVIKYSLNFPTKGKQILAGKFQNPYYSIDGLHNLIPLQRKKYNTLLPPTQTEAKH